ncbi:hypothetical protein H0H87_006509 [Tephrocybe sp. NHM501043]|nr:hypothetical protein H0H87_006509 [Tephrocybe sp. NHM501043]
MEKICATDDSDMTNLDHFPIHTLLPYRLSKNRPWPWVSVFHEDLAEMKEVFATCVDDNARKAFIKERRKIMADIKAHAALCKKWGKSQSEDRNTELQLLRDERREAIVKKLVALGYEPDFAYIRPYHRFENHEVVNQPQKLTECIWANIRETLVKFMADVRVKRLKHEHIELVNLRKLSAVAIFRTHVAQFLPSTNEMIPSGLDFCAFPPVKEILEQPTEVTVDESSFGNVIPLIPGFVTKWRQSLDFHLLQVMKDEVIEGHCYNLTKENWNNFGEFIGVLENEHSLKPDESHGNDTGPEFGALNDCLPPWLKSHAQIILSPEEVALPRKLKLATTVFTCLKCTFKTCSAEDPDIPYNTDDSDFEFDPCHSPSNNRLTPLFYPEVKGHYCLSRRVREEPSQWQLVEELPEPKEPARALPSPHVQRRQWSAHPLSMNTRLGEYVKVLVELAGLDPGSTTADDMDNLGMWFACLKCGGKCSGKEQILNEKQAYEMPIFTWRLAFIGARATDSNQVEHQGFEHSGRELAWKKIAPEQLDAAVEAFERHPKSSHNRAEALGRHFAKPKEIPLPRNATWTCVHCRDTPDEVLPASWEAIQTHLSEKRLSRSMEDSPALVLAPPLNSNLHTQPSSPSSFNSTQARARPTSETTIFSIYSMYGEERQRTSWSASSLSDRKSHETHGQGHGSVVVPPVPTVKIRLPDNHRLSTQNEDDDTELAYYDDHDITHDSIDPQAQVKPVPTRIYTPTPTSSSLHASEDARESLSLRTSATSSRLSHLTQNASLRYSHVRSDSDRDILSLPPLPPSLPPSRHATPPPRQTSSRPVTPPRVLSLKHPVASKISLTPSEGEDMDAFHVRSTYAQLEVSGVKGDGFEDGVERTRARIGPSRASQLNANAALGDGSEKSKSLTAKELSTIASVDRYGFFAVPSHDRLVLLSSVPLLKRLGPVAAGPPNASSSATALSALPPVLTPPKEASRIGKWTRMLTPLKRDPGANVTIWGVRQAKEAKLRRRVYKGIPDAWRPASWELLMARHTGGRGMEELEKQYNEALDKPSTYDIQIDLDVPRTISGHIMFRTRYGAGQRSLFHVLHSFSLLCPKCGYVQGMGPITFTLLSYLTPPRAYAALVILHSSPHYSLHTLFSPGFPGLLENIYIQERIMQSTMPQVYEACKKHGVSTTAYATKWYITLFCGSVPFQMQLRMWDAFLLEGYEVFVGVAVAIVWVYRDQITSASANFETILSLLSSFFVAEDEDVLMAWMKHMLGDKKLRASMREWREEWRHLVKEGKEGDALL